jgi:Tol biopolymer transport system component
LYSTDITGNSKINFVSNKTNEKFSDPKEVQFLNTEFEDLYPTFNADNTKIYFCSNRNGVSFDFYYVNVNPEMDIELLLSDNSNHEILLDSLLSSSSDDKCPFIFVNKMVFASDRNGGFGGFDLYYSIFENEKWSEPINFGDKINTEFDEFRPILINDGVSETQTMMVFSSNRTGGLGGFDLYFVGIEK